MYPAPLRLTGRSPAMAHMYETPGRRNTGSVEAPSVLFDDMAPRRPTGEIPNVPYAKHSFFERKRNQQPH
jgi:hypothetical protein